MSKLAVNYQYAATEVTEVFVIQAELFGWKKFLVQLEYNYWFYKFGAFSAILGMKISTENFLEFARVYGARAKAANVLIIMDLYLYMLKTLKRTHRQTSEFTM